MSKKSHIIKTTSIVAGGAALALFLVGLLNVASAPPASAGCNLDTIESTIHDLVNQARQDRGLSPLTYHCGLAFAGDLHSGHMGKFDFFSHTGLDGSSPQSRIFSHDPGGNCVRADGSWSIGENIYWQTGNYDANDYSLYRSAGQAAFNSWMNSDGHRENILNPSFVYEGIGWASYHGKIYITQDFC